MAYDDSLVLNYVSNYEEMINTSLMMVGKEHEYLPSDNIETDTGKVRVYRSLFAKSIRYVINSYDMIWLRTIAKITQGADIEEGWGYLPNDFLAMLDESTKRTYQSPDMKLTTEGKGIVPMVGTHITYVRQPRSPYDLTPKALDLIQMYFLKSCSMLDKDWQQLSPLLESKYAMSEMFFKQEIADINNRSVMNSRLFGAKPRQL